MIDLDEMTKKAIIKSLPPEQNYFLVKKRIIDRIETDYKSLKSIPNQWKFSFHYGMIEFKVIIKQKNLIHKGEKCN